MYRDIIDGYIFDVTKSLSRKDRQTVEEILYDEIYVRLEEEQKQKGYDTPSVSDVKTILEDLGTPEDVQRRFTTGDSRPHIPQPYKKHFTQDLSLAILFSLITFLGIGFIIMRPDFSMSSILKTGFSLIGPFAVVYGMMYFLYSVAFNRIAKRRLRKNEKLYVDTIMPRPTRGNNIGKVGIIWEILVSSVLVTIFGFGYKLMGMALPSIVILEVISFGLLPLIIIVYAINVLQIAYKEIDRTYTLGVLITTILTHLGRVAIAGILFGMFNYVDPRVATRIESVLPEGSLSYLLMSNLGISIFLIVVALAVLHIVYVAVSYHSYKKKFSPVVTYEDEYVDEEEFEEPEIEEVKVAQPIVDEPVTEETTVIKEPIVVEQPEVDELEHTRVMPPTLTDKVDEDILYNPVANAIRNANKE